ncbi:lipopolysaccharide biosynthesis protein [Faecalibacter bovis]|uniref:Oligosaccharide flippase family protein n=1 Tax=Faecalibacter bovis TaxID=2898187 RepID=A0ABX7XGC6_9FLAO|nr:oligosaccharide flippase family protein [Faecalibacter bovis]QTV06634.1 oligosaccharide flippase family protein [Faecalibacter bovis]
MVTFGDSTKSDNVSSNKKIAKNALFLYFRMFLTMGVGLYTSRIVLQTLGVEDYGIYGLVGGIVTMFSFLNSAMSSATQRYLSFDIGKGDSIKLQQTFNATLNIHILIAGIIFILAETIGLWFVNYQLNIPTDRLNAANWVYQFSILTFVLGVLQVPYNALLIAREHMNVYAYISILEAILKLIIVLILVKFGQDKLILYAVLTFTVSFIIRMLYKIYCKKNFKESVYKFYYDKAFYKELLSYSGWSLFGNIAAIARSQGSNILLNLFFGPVANAAYSLTVMVQGIIGSFVGNFQTALNPQITKNYAKGEVDTALNLIFKSSKYSFFAMFILIVPFLYNVDYVMYLWLGEVPPYAIEFIKLALIYSLIETISNPLMIGAQATGRIKWYQIIIGSFIFLTLPITWGLLKIKLDPNIGYYVLIGNSIIALIFRIIFLKNMIALKILDFFKKVLLPIIFVTLISGIIILSFEFKFNTSPFMQLLINCIIISIIVLFIILIIGMDKLERKYLVDILKNKLFKM